MSWDAIATVRFGESLDPIKRFTQIVDRLAKVPKRLLVRRGRYESDIDGAPMARFVPLEVEGEAAAAAAKSLVGQYSGSELAVEGWWEAKRFRLGNTGEVEKDDYRAIITCVGSDFYFPVLRNERADVVYELGDWKRFSPKLRGDAARKNIVALVEEVCAFVEMGATQMRALDADQSAVPATCWMVFHHTPEGYSDDMTAVAGGRATLLTHEDILEAVVSAPDVTAKEVAGGLLVWNTDGADGDLVQFYLRLA